MMEFLLEEQCHIPLMEFQMLVESKPRCTPATLSSVCSPNAPTLSWRFLYSGRYPHIYTQIPVTLCSYSDEVTFTILFFLPYLIRKCAVAVYLISYHILCVNCKVVFLPLIYSFLSYFFKVLTKA